MDQPLTINNEDYVTVVAVGSSKPPEENTPKDYVTVLKIGNEDTQNEDIQKDDENQDVQNEDVQKETTEEVLVYRLPGEKLGFGLKFEGGTKSAEFVKRLFIQSCALNSPASRVQCSWGLLVEGDEILEIDAVPVNTMTRIDCVRCLKDSNVVIKLLIKHRFEESLKEDLPLVVSAEKKRTPPPPPPVPPRKMNRKSKENSIVIPPKGFGDISGEPPVPLTRQNCSENNFKNKQSPYNSFRKLRQSPEVNKKLRKLSEDSCPPDAEVYTDLFSQESAYSLSESDDTGSSISTVVDRLGSYPATTTSSFSGSLPSTPTPVQKHIDFSNENYLFSKLVEENVPKSVETLQPPANFQDAPLSYGNEDVKIEQIKIIEEIPSPPPRSKNGLKKDEELPRLVDFVPKTSSITNSIEIVKHFLENEKCYIVMDNNENHINDNWCEEEFYSLEWSPSSKLATIGEDEEETIQEECVNTENPVVIIENADSCAPDEISEKSNLTYLYDYEENDLEQIMDVPPIYSRQPPDGHEFPDYQEDNKEEPIVEQISEKPPPIKPREIWKLKCEPPKNNVRDKIAMFSNTPTNLTKKYISTDNITLSDNPEKYKTLSRSELTLEIKDDSKLKGDFDLNLSKEEEEPVFRKLSGRSMSLCDVSTNKPDKWSAMVEQRRKCLSRLKGLVIPENIPEIEVNVKPFVDLPEIKSEITVPIFPEIKKSETPKPNYRHTYSFSPKTPSKVIQKQKSPSKEIELTVNVNNQNDPPKSLESITSPTRSDYSFEYIYSPEIKSKSNGFLEKSKIINDVHEDESDNDSALSSSQSSYISKNSPPASPTGQILSKSDSNYDSLNRRLLKAQSVEAINRKNILASARCRSGRDLKVGSPLIQRKFEEEHKNEILKTEIKTLKKEIEKIDSKEILTRSTSETTHRELIKSETEIVFNKQRSLVDIVPKTRFVKAASVNDLRKNFEKESPKNSPTSKKSPEISPEPKPTKRTSIPPEISPEIYPKNDEESSQDITKIKSMVFDEYGISPEIDLKIICLKPDVLGGSIGITLAGGADYETKEITIHKIRTGSPANRDGQLEKGDRILFINGKSMKNLSHGESLKVLKEKVPKVVITACASKDVQTSLTPRRQSAVMDQVLPKIVDDKKIEVEEKSVGEIIEVTIQKDGAGLGFSIQGGQDSPQGNVPLVVKKLFVGGAAEKSGKLKAGDELLSINGVDLTCLSRIDAWNIMKKLPEGDIIIRVQR
nr:uncharacterized protein LOC111419468 [Onthophagus taurus]